MPGDDLYWNSIDFGSEESLHEMSSSKKPYVDPWDLENYAYIRQHMDSVELNSEQGGSSGGEFAEANSTSFYYVPGTKNLMTPLEEKPQKYDSLEQGNYAAIDDLKIYDTRKARSDYVVYERAPMMIPENGNLDSEPEESPYEEGIKAVPQANIHDRRRKIPPHGSKSSRDRSLSFSYGDRGYDSYGTRSDGYYRLDDFHMKKDSTLPLYDDLRGNRRKPKNFSLSNYGHLKIDYSYSWNNLNKYICN